MTLSNIAKERRRQARIAENLANVQGVEPKCVECGKLAVKLVGWTALYRARPDRPDLMAKKFWLCECGAFVGCHAGSEIPLGFPAGKATQVARRAAHAAFDPLWLRKAAEQGISRKQARGAGYKWLADQLGISREDCHIGMMTADMARRVVELSQPRRRTATKADQAEECAA